MGFDLDTLRGVNLVRHIEKRLEDAMEGLAGKMFKGQLHAVELVTRMVREGDLAVTEGPAGPNAPNEYEVRIPPDLVTTDLPGEYVQELARGVEDMSIERGWRLEGPVRVTLIEDSSKAGISITASETEGPLVAWGRLTGSDGQFDLTFTRNVVGRAEASDIHVSQSHVSRLHALLWRDGSGVWVQDAKSSNGTSVNGTAISSATQLVDGAVVGFGPSAFTFRSLA